MSASEVVAASVVVAASSVVTSRNGRVERICLKNSNSYTDFFSLISRNVSIKSYSPTRQGELSEADLAHHGALLGVFLHSLGQTYSIS